MEISKVTRPAVRFLLTWIAFGAMAVLTHTFYPGFNDVRAFIYVALEVGAFAIAVHAAVRGVPRLNRSYKLLVVVFCWAMVRDQMTKWRIFSPFSNIVLNLAFWTAFTAFALWTTYAIVYRWRLLDRDGPVAQRLGVA